MKPRAAEEGWGRPQQQDMFGAFRKTQSRQAVEFEHAAETDFGELVRQDGLKI